MSHRPSDFFEGRKEGYFFSSGLRGVGATLLSPNCFLIVPLGYYLDARAWDINDPDEDGYVLVRVAPAVAVHRVPK